MYIAVDVGGTQIRVAVYPKGEIHPAKQKRIPTQANNETPLERLMGLIAELWPQSSDPVFAIAVAVPGWVDPQQGVIHVCPNIPGWEKLPLASILAKRFGVPVKLGNDANMAVVGEWRYGAGQGHHNLIYMTISTGIGGGVICDDRLLLGEHGLAAELGHVTILPDGPMCSCGHRGHLEALASGTAIGHYVSDQLAQGVPSLLSQIVRPTGRDISMAAEQGDPLAKSALARSGMYIGLALSNYLQIFNPSIVILGGGVSKSGPFLLEPMRASLAEHILSPEYMQGLVITTAALGDDAGLMGALALASGAVN
ncbi:MAG: ROK family protein [Anaerolineaceae bacterium]|nr:ROK family protein [Anaerolineaceae bacterium]